MTSFRTLKGLAVMMIVVIGCLPTSHAGDVAGARTGVPHVLWSAANPFGAMTIAFVGESEGSFVTPIMEFAFVDSAGGAFIVRADAGRNEISFASAGGTLRVVSLGEGRVRLEASTPDGLVRTLVSDSKAIDEEAAEAVRAVAMPTLAPARATLAAWTDFALHEGLVAYGDEGSIEPLPPEIQAMLPDWAQCGLSVIGFISSAAGLVGCVTIVGCVWAVAGMTASGIAVGDTCGAALSGGGSAGGSGGDGN